MRRGLEGRRVKQPGARARNLGLAFNKTQHTHRVQIPGEGVNIFHPGFAPLKRPKKEAQSLFPAGPWQTLSAAQLIAVTSRCKYAREFRA